MLKILKMNEINSVPYPALKAYISKKMQKWKVEYAIENLDEIGCFVVLDKSETQMFETSEMEFVETLNLDNETYLHGVKMIDDCYGEDTFLIVEGVRK